MAPSLDPGSAALIQTSDRGSEDRVSRWDSPWWEATDEELVQAVAEVDGQVTIGFKPPGADAGVDIRGHRAATSADVVQGRQVLASLGASITREHGLIPAVSAVIDPEDVPELRQNPLIDYVEPRSPPFRLLAGDTMWAAEAIQAPLAWDSTTGAGVTVAVLDTGIYGDHPYLDPEAPLHDCIGGTGVDTHGHGTVVSGLIAATLSGGEMTGAAYGVTVRSYRLGAGGVEPDRIECGLLAALDDGVDIVNMSFGGDTVITEVADAIAVAHAEGLILVGAGGNPPDDQSILFPARLPQVIAVLGVDQNNERPSGTPTGPWVELVAPGIVDEILTTCRPPASANCKPGAGVIGGGGVCETCKGGSSSLATALVTASAALLKSHEPGWDNEEVRARLRATALDLGTPGVNWEFGYGLVQAYDALVYDLPPGPSVDVTGPDAIDPTETCTWNAHVTDGVPPFSYNWFVHSSSPVGSGPSYTGGEPGGNTGNDFNLFVVVTDHVGRVAEDEIIVTLDGSAPPCLI
jgi:subtilisin family serine protease